MGLQLVRLLAESNRVDQATTLLNQLAKQHPQQLPADRINLEQGWLYLSSQDFAKARNSFEAFGVANRGSAAGSQALLKAAEIAHQMGDLDGAKRNLEQLSESNLAADLKSAYWYRRGRLSFDRQDYPDAESAFSNLEKLGGDAGNPFRDAGRYWLAESAAARNDDALATQRFQKLVTQPDLPARYRETAQLRLLQQRLAKRQIDGLVEEASALTQKAETNEVKLESVLLIGETYVRQAKFDQARAQFQKVIDSSNPADSTNGSADSAEVRAKATFYLGQTYFHQQRYREAAKLFQTVDTRFELPRWQSLALFEAAKCYSALNESEPVEAAINRLKNQFPNEPATKLALEWQNTLRSKATSGQGKD